MTSQNVAVVPGELFLKEVEDIVNVSFFIKFLLLFWSFGGRCWPN